MRVRIACEFGQFFVSDLSIRYSNAEGGGSICVSVRASRMSSHMGIGVPITGSPRAFPVAALLRSVAGRAGMARAARIRRRFRADEHLMDSRVGCRFRASTALSWAGGCAAPSFAAPPGATRTLADCHRLQSPPNSGMADPPGGLPARSGGRAVRPPSDVGVARLSSAHPCSAIGAKPEVQD